MAKKASKPKMPATVEREQTSQARIELASPQMERVRKAARSIGLSLSAFIRQAVLEKTVDVEQRMGRGL